MWPIFKAFMEFATILLLFYVLGFFFFFWPWGMWYLSSLIRDQTHTPCMRRQSFKHWTTREVQHQFLMLETSVDLGPVASGSSQNWFQEFVIPPALQVIFCMLKFEKHCSRESVTSKLEKKKTKQEDVNRESTIFRGPSQKDFKERWKKQLAGSLQGNL